MLRHGSAIENTLDVRWFLRAYDFFGEKIGSKEKRRKNIYRIAGFCIMAEVEIMTQGTTDWNRLKNIRLPIRNCSNNPHSQILYKHWRNSTYTRVTRERRNFLHNNP
jgi:hypothetical protein